METKPNDSITPTIGSSFDFADVNREKIYTTVFQDDLGLTKREYFAAKALQGLLANNGSIGEMGGPETVTNRSVVIADALIKALNDPGL